MSQPASPETPGTTFSHRGLLLGSPRWAVSSHGASGDALGLTHPREEVSQKPRSCPETRPP